MRYIVYCTILFLSHIAFSQTYRFYNLGQVIASDNNACLVIKNKSKYLKQPVLIDNYKSISTVKFVGFIDQNLYLDSIIRLLKPLNKINTVIFENCDLSYLETSFSQFKSLEMIMITKECSMFENTFFPLLKNNQIKKLYIQTSDPDLITDSIQCLPHLQTISISSNGLFKTANQTQTIHIANDSYSQNIDFVYYGTHYKNNPTAIKPVKSKTTTPITAQLSKPDYIKQPIPGININDTLYHLNPSRKNAFSYGSGSKLVVDANVFISQNGTPYNGPVTLFYREFRNPVEIMLSGIPMSSVVNGKTLLFKSGGMYELNAFDKQNKPLTLNSDTAIKINFALTDTSSSFKFYSLNNKGSWDTLNNSVNIIKPDTSSNLQASVAVIEYYKILKTSIKNKADTLNYMARFYNNDYLYTYRKDNFPKDERNRNPLDTTYTKTDGYKKKSLKTRALFRVKYLKQTKDKEIVFVIVPARKHAIPPSYIYALFNKTYLYNGTLTKEDFKAQFNRKLLCWDVRTISFDNTVNLDIKTTKSHYNLSGQIITLHNDKTYTLQKRSGKIVNQKIARIIKRDAKEFNKKTRLSYGNLNNINHKRINNSEDFAYKHSLAFQNTMEKKYSHTEWKIYAQALFQKYLSQNPIESYNEIGNALLKSGLGIKNIDCYIHSGSMQDVFVNYNNMSFDSISNHYSTILFKSINTNFPLTPDYVDKALTGYYYKNNPNYIIRFSSNQMMQVTKPTIAEEHKKLNTINIDYIDQFNVKGMNSNDITKLILN
jgi:hypothetical protein